MSVVLVTGSAGLIGSEAAMYFGRLGFDVVGIDNDMRREFFGEDGSTAWNTERLRTELGDRFTHYDADIRDRARMREIIGRYARSLELVIHTAAQPSHDWAARQPFTDFDINAVGTLNVLEEVRRQAPDTVFIYTSTNKVYGDTPNRLPLIERETRYELPDDHTYADGIREDMSIDRSLHSLFGASKTAADLLVQEYGRYFDMRTACFRGGTLTGPQHSATELHGFLAYVMRCTMVGDPYTIYGYKGKQVRDVIHSEDLIRAFHEFYRAPRVAEVYNIGGGRTSNCSVLEAIRLSEEITGRELRWRYSERNRIGDHLWWIGDNGRFRSHYPDWRVEHTLEDIIGSIYEANRGRWRRRTKDAAQQRAA